MNRMMMISLALAGAVAGLVAGCASLSEDQCRQGDWASIGQADGYAGYAMTRLQDHTEACRKVGITPDAAAYSRGRQAGLRGYCTVSRGFTEGRLGNSYAGVCPPDLAPAFMAAYNDGRVVNVALVRRNAAISAGRDAANRIRKFDSNIRDAQAKLAASGAPDAQKTALRGQIAHMRKERQQEMNRARDARRDLRGAEEAVAELRGRFAGRYPSWQ